MSRPPTSEQVSAGGVVFNENGGVEVALISVAGGRWQLPKGLIDPGETPEVAAQREVREETGLEAELLAPLDSIDYWYYGTRGGARRRFHKVVHFYLFRYVSGDVRDHDHEVDEARWFDLAEAERVLAFRNEREVVVRAGEVIITL